MPETTAPVRNIIDASRRIVAVEETLSEHAGEIAELNGRYARILATLSDIREDLSQVRDAIDRQQDRPSASTVIVQPAPPHSHKPPREAPDWKFTSALLAIVVALSQILAEVIKFALHK